MADRSDAPCHCLVSRRPSPFRSSRAACCRRNQAAADLPLRFRRDLRAGPARGRSAARRAGGWRNRCGLAEAPWRPRRAAAFAQRTGRQDHSRGRARKLRHGRILERRLHKRRSRHVERGVATALQGLGIAAHSFAGDLLAAPERMRTKEGRGMRVFTPFWRRIQAMGEPADPLPAPRHLHRGPSLASDTIESFKSRTDAVRTGPAACVKTSTPGESAAQKRLKIFLKQDLAGYAEDRDRPDRDGTSRPVAASALRRSQPAPGLARRAICRGRASCTRKRYRQVPERTRLARILPASVCSRCPISTRAVCNPRSMPFRGGTTRRH